MNIESRFAAGRLRRFWKPCEKIAVQASWHPMEASELFMKLLANVTRSLNGECHA